MVKTWTALSGVALAVVLVGCGTTSNNTTSPGTSAANTTQSTTGTNVTANSTATATNSGSTGTTSSKWLSYDASTKTADLTLEAGVTGGFDFNGYSKGAMTVTIPQGWTVDVTFTNEASNFHSAMIVPFSQVQAGQNFTPAFSGASSPNPSAGSSKGVTQKFSFTASKAGKYGIVCAVPGHDDAGMWDTLVVSSSATTPSVSTQ